VLMEARALAAHEPVIAAAVRAADDRVHEQLEVLVEAAIRAGKFPAGTDPALTARLFTTGLYGLMTQWHLAPGSFSWAAAAAALAAGLAHSSHWAAGQVRSIPVASVRRGTTAVRPISGPVTGTGAWRHKTPRDGSG
jgi:hypothetical protein